MLKIDALFNFMGVLLFFILVLIAQINPPDTQQIAQPGNMIVSISWPEGEADVDLWVRYVSEPAVGYSNKSGKTFSLLRDDLGISNDISGLNYESSFSRGIPDGEYVVNVRCFSCVGSLPVPVVVEVMTASGTTIWRGVVPLDSNKDERTALRWKMAGGAVVPGSESHVFKNIRGVE